MHSIATHAPRTAAAPCGASARCIGVVPGPLARKRSIKEKFATMVGHLTVTFKEVATCPEQRPDLARSGAAVATGPPGAPAVIMIGGKEVPLNVSNPHAILSLSLSLSAVLCGQKGV